MVSEPLIFLRFLVSWRVANPRESAPPKTFKHKTKHTKRAQTFNALQLLFFILDPRFRRVRSIEAQDEPLHPGRQTPFEFLFVLFQAQKHRGAKARNQFFQINSSWSILPTGRMNLEKLTWKTWSGRIWLEELAWKNWPGRIGLEELAWKNWPGRIDLEELTSALLRFCGPGLE